MSLDRIAYCKIHPGIGVARLGNSPDQWFVGTEAPGDVPQPPGGFKDSQGRIKRQAARFRLYAYDQHGTVLQELTAAEAEIQWTVHLVNRKAAWYQFAGKYHPDQPLRNPEVDDRSQLVIDPGARTIAGINQQGSAYHFDSGKFFQESVPLGELQTDESGHLLVLGGFGQSGAINVDQPITNYANNDGWFDDTSDGPVTATVVLKVDDRAIPVTSAWVLVAPPKYAPALSNLVRLSDVALQVAIDQHWLPAPNPISFTQDIYPLLMRAANYQWVNLESLRGHGPGKGGDFSDPDLLKRLADRTDQAAPLRHKVFERFRHPDAIDPQQANYYYMPQLSGDDGDAAEGQPRTWLTLLPMQYEMLRQWAAGNFENDWNGEPPPPPALAEIALAEQPMALDRAALEPCVGGAFYPGIEVTYIATQADLYTEPFRFTPTLAPGDVTKHMALPWQADFYECNTHWWPAQRPDSVVTETEYLKVLHSVRAGYQEPLAQMLLNREPWARGVGGQIVYKPNLPHLPHETPEHYEQRMQQIWKTLREYAGDNDMVDRWSQLGFVVAQKGPQGETVFVETEREPFVGLDQREYFYLMLNIDFHPEFLPKARSLAHEFLAQAWERQQHPDLPDYYRYFEYSKEALNTRLDEIYNDLLNLSIDYDPAQDPVFKTRSDVVDRLYQWAPFNQLDGTWLRFATQAGPINEVHALLFAIWLDEAGNGTCELNHSNLATELMHSLGVYLPEINTRDYAFNPNMLDSAYTVPLFELVISQFSQTFFPELLGMTLQLEWEVLTLRPWIKLLNYFDIDPHFFTLHVGIDNAAAGHGAKAKQAVQRYLDQVFAAGGNEAVEQGWRRIWNGYVAFATTGTLADDIINLVQHKRSLPLPQQLHQQMITMLERKKPYASLNHGTKKVGPNLINDWFEDPEAFLQALVEHGYINPQSPEESLLFTQFSFDGPMYKVFTADEIQLWHDWARSLQHTPATEQPWQPLNRLQSAFVARQTDRHPRGKIWGMGSVH